jgi:hypothetical protein
VEIGFLLICWIWPGMRGVPETASTGPPPIRIAKTFLAGQRVRVGPRDRVYICGLPGDRPAASHMHQARD